MDYLLFDLVAVALPTALLLRGRSVRGLPCWPVAALALAALLWTAPWDDHLVRTHVWAYAPGEVLGRLGAVPVEEYAFVVLEVLLVGAWALRTGALVARPILPEVPARRLRGALGWGMVVLVGAVLVLLGGHLRYAGLVLVWAAPPLALQHLVAGDVLAARRLARARCALPVAGWLCAADRVALAAGTWRIAPASSSGVAVLGLPVEEALFFGLTVVLVADGLMLACDAGVRARAGAVVRHLWRPSVRS